MSKNAAYGCSKAAVTMLAKTMALEEARHDVRVNVVSPGAILTGMIKKVFEGGAGGELSLEQVNGGKKCFQFNLQPICNISYCAHVV